MESNLHSNGSDSVPDYSSFCDGSIMLNPQFQLGDIVYLKTDSDQYRHIVTGIVIRPGRINYKLSMCDKETEFEAIEISVNPDKNIKMGI